MIWEHKRIFSERDDTLNSECPTSAHPTNPTILIHEASRTSEWPKIMILLWLTTTLLCEISQKRKDLIYAMAEANDHANS
jgi:hypothetical protein